jgi:hypothetical protein
MKFGFLCHQFGDQFLGPVNRDLIRDGPLYPAIPLNILVDLVALFTHWTPFQAGANRATCQDNTTAALLSFNKLELFQLGCRGGLTRLS